MTTFLISTICALITGLNPSNETRDTVSIYMINNEKVENFDGSQLKMQTILSYDITFRKNEEKNVVEKVHDIITDNFGAARKHNKAARALIMIDGKIVANDLSGLDPKRISQIKFYKPGTENAAAYGEKGKSGVLIISTNEGKSELNGNIHFIRMPEKESVVYIIDGKKITAKAFEELKPDEIKEIKILKKGAEEIKKLGYDVNRSYIIITKKKK